MTGDVTASPPISELGFDPLLAMPDESAFAAAYARRAAPIKAALLDQKIAAGVGNWIADEVLYHAKIHPEASARTLSAAQLREVRRAMGHVVETACLAGADAERFPSDWLFHRRWGKVAGKIGGKAISFITVGGRTTAFVPGVQKKGEGGEGGSKQAGVKRGSRGGGDEAADKARETRRAGAHATRRRGGGEEEEEEGSHGCEESPRAAQEGGQEGTQEGTQEGAEKGTQEGAEKGTQEGAEKGTQEGAQEGCLRREDSPDEGERA